MNKFIGIGRLVRDAEIKEVKGGKQLANFSIAITRAYNKEQTDFINCVAWGKTAEYLGKYGKKGQLVSVDGELNIDKVNDKYYTKVNTSSVSILSSKSDVQEQTQTVQTASFDTVEPSFDDFEKDLAPKKENTFDISDDDLPF